MPERPGSQRASEKKLETPQEDDASRESIKGDTVIHVIDDIRQIRKDFYCKQSQLLEHMKYFEACLAGVSPDDEVEISVHCDIKVFEWLVEYMDGSRQVSSLEAKDVVAILISADFLQMQALVEQCLEAMYNSLTEILALPLDLGCLPERLVASLASQVKVAELEKLQDDHDRLLSRLYAHKLLALLSLEQNVLFCCSRCQRLFTADECLYQHCAETTGMELSTTKSVPALLQHSADATWDVGEFLHHLRERHSWPQLFWKTWARLQRFQCNLCQMTFCGLELNRCHFHPPLVGQESVAIQDPNHGGGEMRQHEPKLSSIEEEVAIETLRRHQDEICKDCESLLFAPVLNSKGLQVDAKGEEEPERVLEIRARYCCEPPPEHSATAAPSTQASQVQTMHDNANQCSF
ncbi:unnamed protein product [Durusdinium trenchii]|uniref:SANT and BTB domain-containing protein n=1 Tax=Durusdinium trenchii TaxID=1381693 RepID=A0ABP0RFI7_9DINO